MASLTRPVKAWGLLAARAVDRDRVEARKAVARAMANLKQTDLIRTFLLEGFLLDAMMANSLSSRIQNNTENADVGISPFAAGHRPYLRGSKCSETSTVLSWSSGVSWTVIFHWSAGYWPLMESRNCRG